MKRNLNNLDEAKQLFNIISKAGYLLLKSGAEAKRIEETISIMGKSVEGFEYVNSFAQHTALYITSTYGSEKLSTMERCDNPSTDLSTIALVNELSRTFASTDMSLDEASNELEKIENISPKKIMSPIGASLTSGFFTLMFGGNIGDFISSIVIGFLVWYILFNTSIILPQFFSDFFSGLLTSTLALLFVKKGLGTDVDMIMIGVIMPYVPGTPVTAGIRDILAGHHLTGIMMIIKAIIIAFAIALGALMPLYTLL